MKVQRSILFIVLLLAIAGIFSYLYFQPTREISKNTTSIQTQANKQGSSSVNLNVPAVDNQGNGVVTVLHVEAKPGSGKTLVDINGILFFVDTQNSIQIAKTVAANLTHIDLSSIDLIYSVQTNASIIEGPSAGAALTISTIAALEGKQLNNSVMLTGTINPDGTIGPVGGISAKTKAAKDLGAKIFLVPSGQGTQTTYTPVQNCEQIGVINYCTTEYKAAKIDMSKDLGIYVKEVGTVQDVLQYFGLS